MFNQGSTKLNARLAKQRWPEFITKASLCSLSLLTEKYDFSIAAGEVQLLGGQWYITHSGLIHLAKERRCAGIHAFMLRNCCDPTAHRWVFKATVFKTRTCKGFVGYGDADPSNVSPLMHGAEMRIAETRAVNRALRKAYGLGICSVEEIGSFPSPHSSKSEAKGGAARKLPPQAVSGNGSNGNGTRVRDRLCQIIRQHQLDATLVKSYAVDFCGTKSLREATRGQVENFVVHLAAWAEKDRNALLCQLNSYMRSQEGAA